MKFTAKSIEALRPKDSDYTKREKHGFAIRVHPSGRMAWLFIYDFAGRRRKMTLGHYPEISLSDARKLHTRARAMLDQGVDPGAKKREEARKLRLEPRVKDVVAEYMENHRFLKLANSSKVSYRATYEKEVLPELSSLRISEVQKADIHRILDRVMARGAQIQAKRTRAHLHRLLNYAVEMGYIEFNPCTQVKLAVKENVRVRFLTEDEIRLLWRGLEATGMSEMYKLAFRLQLTTGQRKGEVCMARWSDISWIDATWTIPKEVAKNRTRHMVYLSSLSLELLQELHEMTGRTDFLLPSPNDFSMSVRPNSLDQALHKEFAKLGIKERFRPHDLRRTCATHLDRLSVRSDVISRILNHSLNRGVTGVYTQHAAVEEMKRAMETWASELREILDLPPTSLSTGNVIDLKATHRSDQNHAHAQGGS